MTNNFLSNIGGLIYLSKLMQEEVRYHWKRTRVPTWQIVAMLNARDGKAFKSLGAYTINHWIAYRVRWVERNHWDAVLNLWCELPDANEVKPSPPDRKVGYPKNVTGTSRIEITGDMHCLFLDEFARTGAEPLLDIVQHQDAPDGLNERVIQILRLRSAKTVRSDYWAFITAMLRMMPDKLVLYDGSK